MLTAVTSTAMEVLLLLSEVGSLWIDLPWARQRLPLEQGSSNKLGLGANLELRPPLLPRTSCALVTSRTPMDTFPGHGTRLTISVVRNVIQ